MDLPINDEELNTIIKAMSLGGDVALFQKLKLVKELREQGLPDYCYCWRVFYWKNFLLSRCG